MDNDFHSLYIDQEKCAGKMKCLRVCPTEAIRVRKGKALILEDRCIDCGECIKVCPNKAIVPLTNSFTEFSQFEYIAAIPSPVLYSQFNRDINPTDILNGLKAIGFDDAIDLTPSCESVSIAIQEYLNDNPKERPIISSFCPTVIRLIQVKYPGLAGLLLPVDSPMEISARDWKLQISDEKGIKVEKIGAIYITPCPSKMRAIRQHPRKRMSFLDGAISIQDIYNPLLSALLKSERKNLDSDENMKYGVGLAWAILGGQAKFLKAENSVAVGGINHVIHILDDIENGKIKDINYVECHACIEGCIGGSLTIENPYVSRSNTLHLLKIYGEEFSQNKSKIKTLYKKGYFSLNEKLTSYPLQPLDRDLAEAIKKMKKKEEIFRELPQLDCGLCGSPTCMTFAEDVIRGKVPITDCIFKSFKQSRKQVKEFYESNVKNTLPQIVN